LTERFSIDRMQKDQRANGCVLSYRSGASHLLLDGKNQVPFLGYAFPSQEG
jgi:hypothetical protein